MGRAWCDDSVTASFECSLQVSLQCETGGYCMMRYIAWIGLHDAVEKGYLETMTFGLCRDKEQTDLVEQFQYKFAYESDVVTMADSFGTDVAIPLSQSSQVYHLFLCTSSCTGGGRLLHRNCWYYTPLGKSILCRAQEGPGAALLERGQCIRLCFHLVGGYEDSEVSNCENDEDAHSGTLSCPLSAELSYLLLMISGITLYVQNVTSCRYAQHLEHCQER